ncbi:flagellar protein FliT [Paenibacillus sp. 19GGS1-52]|uniref:flagellar protein FliT n=1 Tax=Paenibacillus sp. 19GGS1-52 TaxID=2758563 RepID=UPI001EFBB61C|nr:flagellar protein FliT [Paenibacillus sp. 19GGS1-52]ULO07956.1 flagellar protein FliT [Paenibacillus sp. 19GGS1-52]
MTQGIMDRLYEVPYEELESFVEERQDIVDSIGEKAAICQLTSMQEQEINRILEHDSAILAAMNAHRLEAQDWLQKRNQAKVQRNAYDMHYAPDSILMDRKK